MGLLKICRACLIVVLQYAVLMPGEKPQAYTVYIALINYNMEL